MADGSLALQPGAFLGVRRSVTDRPWVLRAADPNLVRDLGRRFSLSEPAARVLALRAPDLASAEAHLFPTLRGLFPDPSSFRDMDRAAAVLLDALEGGGRVVLFADYDVDGATSAALLIRWCRSLGYAPGLYIPDRSREGYGPSAAAFERIRAEGADLVVTLDCGAAAGEALEAAAALGLKVVVIDHHMMRPGERPSAAALVNPNQPGCASGQGTLAAAGVTFVLLAALNREARRRGLFDAARPEPDLREWLDLAALGAVCDVTQAVGFNRALMAQGLKVMSAWRNPGLRALMEVAKADGAASVFHLGFVLGPRLNAGGRIGRSDLATRLLSTDDPDEARGLAAELDQLNAERKTIEAEALAAAVRQVERESNRGPEGVLVLAAGEDWHPGVVGIVAGRLRERYRRPALVIGVDPVTGIGKGSGRSQPGVNLGRAVQAAYEAGLLLAGGGHAMACGLTVKKDRLPELREFLEAALEAETHEARRAETLEVDALASGAAGAELLRQMEPLEPFGPGAPEPVVAFAEVRCEAARVMRGGHVRVVLKTATGAALPAVAWRSEDTPLGRRLLSGGGAVHVAGRLKRNVYAGRTSVQLEVEDLADPRLIDNAAAANRGS